MSLPAEELRRRRSAAQLLAGPAGARCSLVVGHLLAVQAQQLRSARLALRARSPGVTVAEIDRDLANGSLVVTWLMRGTLHLVRAADFPWLLALTGPRLVTTNRRRLRQEGVSEGEAHRAGDVINGALAESGALTRADLTARLADAGIPTARQAVPHLLMAAALRGDIVLGPITRRGHAFVRAPDWLSSRPDHASSSGAREDALRELARRYLRGHGPASPDDLAAWAGLPLGVVRAAVQEIRSELADFGEGCVDLFDRPPPGGPLPPRLLPSFDPYLLGWRNREFAVPAARAKLVHPGGGVLRAVAIADGRAVGTWSARRRGTGFVVRVEPFETLPATLADGLDQEAMDVARFLDADHDQGDDHAGSPPARDD